MAGADYGLGRILAAAYPDQTKLQEVWKLYTDSLATGGSLLNLTPVKVSEPQEQTKSRGLLRLVAPVNRRYGRVEDALEFQIQSNVQPLHRVVDRRATQQHAVIHARPHRTDQRDLHAAAVVDPEVRLAEEPKALLYSPAPVVK